MKILRPNYEIIQCPAGEEALYHIERAARTCYKSEGKIDVSIFETTINASNDPKMEKEAVITIILEAKSAREMVTKLIQRGHDAMLEFGGLLHVLFTCDRGVSHELVRHRLASFAQESTRYCNYGKDKDVTYILPCWFEVENVPFGEHLSDEVLTGIFDNQKNEPFAFWVATMLMTEEAYLLALDKELNWTPQQARSVLPNSVKTEINMSANLREWRHIFKQRVHASAHPQMRELMIPLLEDMKVRIPVIFDDITY